MIRTTRLFMPGPTPLPPAAQFADMDHRTPAFRALYTRVLRQLKEFVGTVNDVVVLSCSGTGAMEAAVSNLTSPGDRVLVLTAGRFGERWTAIAKSFGCAVDVVSAPYGETFSLDAVKSALKLETRAVFMQATETSTGVRHCVPGVARLLRDTDSEALLVVDAITGLGTTHLDMDGWGVDCLIGGSNSALITPQGLSYLAVGDRAWDRMEASYNPRYYFDLRKERKNARNGASAYTPAVALIAALGDALDHIAAQGGGDLAEGRRLLIETTETIAAMTRAACEAMGLKLFAAEAASPAVTAVLAPVGFTSTQIVTALDARFAAIVADGDGAMTGQTFRIAHLEYFGYMDAIALIGALEQVLVQNLKVPGVEFGTALIAAQNTYANRRPDEAAERTCFCGRADACCSMQHPDYGVTNVKSAL